MAESTVIPVHRAWFAALKADRDVPMAAMCVARVFSAYGARSAGRRVYVTYPTLIEETHATRPTIARAIKYLVEHGWLTPADHQAGKRAYYDFTVAGQVIHTQSSSVTGLRPDQSSYVTGTSKATKLDQSSSVTTNVNNQREHQSLAGVSGPDAALRRLGGTDEQIEWIKAQIKARGARNVSAVLRAEVDAGNARTLLAEATRATYTRPTWCGRCDESSRLVDLPDGRAGRCPDCHPQAARRPLRAVS